MLFGLSMDYEVFLVTRMREFWDEGLSNEEAVAAGLERTGRIVTAAAVVMVAAFSGFAAGSILGLQEFGLGLATAIFLDATDQGRARAGADAALRALQLVAARTGCPCAARGTVSAARSVTRYYRSLYVS